MEKTRKRSFTNYQNDSELTQALLDQVLSEEIQQNVQKNQLQGFTDRKASTLALLKSKKAKILSKFEKYGEKTARQSTQTAKISTIQSLKKQIAALESEQILSYRFKTTKNSENLSDEPRDSENGSEISAILKRFNKLKKEATADKFRRNFLLFGSANLFSKIKTEQACIMSERTSINSDVQSHKKGQMKSCGSKIRNGNDQKSTSSFQRTNSMSLTARRFYGRKQQKKEATEQEGSNLNGLSTIKKLKIGKKVLSSSLIHF